MKKTIRTSVIMLMVAFMSFASACSGDDNENTTNNVVNQDSYYVKYEAQSKIAIKLKYTFSVSYTTELGVKTYEKEGVGYGSSWEGTYGPFKKGNKVILTIKSSSGTCTGRIYVSRNKEPFVIKAEGEGGGVDLSYTIDF